MRVHVSGLRPTRSHMRQAACAGGRRQPVGAGVLRKRTDVDLEQLLIHEVVHGHRVPGSVAGLGIQPLECRSLPRRVGKCARALLKPPTPELQHVRDFISREPEMEGGTAQVRREPHGGGGVIHPRGREPATQHSATRTNRSCK